jgi:hypothetical protein
MVAELKKHMVFWWCEQQKKLLKSFSWLVMLKVMFIKSYVVMVMLPLNPVSHVDHMLTETPVYYAKHCTIIDPVMQESCIAGATLGQELIFLHIDLVTISICSRDCIHDFS